MPKLKWDEIGKRLYETGTKNGVLYPQNAQGEYPQGEAWSGLTGVSVNPSGGDATPYYADDIKYLELRAVENFGGTISAFTHPDGWYECDGCKEIAPGVIVHQQTRVPFGLTWRSAIGNDTEKDNYGYKIHLAWNATASPSGREYSTMNESPEAVNMSWEFTTTPVQVTHPGLKPMSYLELKSTTVPAAKMKQIEDILYGVDAVEATPAEYAATEDETMSATKTYYTRSGAEGSYTYTEFEGESFAVGTTYYEMTKAATAAVASVTPHLPSPDEIFAILNA